MNESMVNIDVTTVSAFSLGKTKDLQDYDNLGKILTVYLITCTRLIIPLSNSTISLAIKHIFSRH
jgi:hypothetical protein